MPQQLRTIKSFILRQGRLTQGQQYALDHYWAELGIDYSEQPLNKATVFKNSAPLVLEIGFGNGTSLATMAGQHPEENFVGIEVHRPGVGRLLHLAHNQNLKNLRVINHDAIDVLENMITDNSLSRVQLYFPDPWHKKKHHKRRIVQPEFMALLSRKIQAGGKIHFATDWQHYAKHMLRVLESCSDFKNDAGAGNYSPRPAYRPVTKFETRGLKLGHGTWDLIYTRL